MADRLKEQNKYETFCLLVNLKSFKFSYQVNL